MHVTVVKLLYMKKLSMYPPYMYDNDNEINIITQQSIKTEQNYIMDENNPTNSAVYSKIYFKVSGVVANI